MFIHIYPILTYLYSWNADKVLSIQEIHISECLSQEFPCYCTKRNIKSIASLGFNILWKKRHTHTHCIMSCVWFCCMLLLFFFNLSFLCVSVIKVNFLINFWRMKNKIIFFMYSFVVRNNHMNFFVI